MKMMRSGLMLNGPLFNTQSALRHSKPKMAQMGADLCRSIGLKRATQHNNLANLVYNMDR